jgi:hypothetical protein
MGYSEMPARQFGKPTLCPCPFKVIVMRGHKHKVQVHRSTDCAGYELDHLYYGEAFTEVPS